MTRQERREKAALEESAALWVLREFIHERGRYEGSPSWILQHLNERATEAQRNAPRWPKNPQQLGRMLNKFARALRAKGVVVCYLRHGLYGRLWELRGASVVDTGNENRNQPRPKSPGNQLDPEQFDGESNTPDDILRRSAKLLRQINVQAVKPRQRR